MWLHDGRPLSALDGRTRGGGGGPHSRRRGHRSLCRGGWGGWSLGGGWLGMRYTDGAGQGQARVAGCGLSREPDGGGINGLFVSIWNAARPDLDRGFGGGGDGR